MRASAAAGVLCAVALLVCGCRSDAQPANGELPSPEYPIPTSAYPPGAGTATPAPTEDVAPVVMTP